MALPVASTAKYELTLPSQQKTIKFRPFLVKEEKVLLMAMESGDAKEMLSAIKEIVKSCTFGEMIAEEYPMFDIEYVFLQIRSKSVGEKTKLKILCPDDGKTYAETEVNLTEVQVQVDEGHTNKIELTDDTGMIMTYPTIDSFTETGITSINAENMIELIGSCVLQIYEDKGEKVYQGKDQTRKELTEFIESMNTAQFKKVQQFFDTMPKLKHTIKVKNPKTKKSSDITLNGLNDFFG